MTWFLLKDEEICGPYETAHIFENCDDITLIWGPGMEEWTDKKSWQTYLNKPKRSERKKSKDLEPKKVASDEGSVEEVAELALHQLNDKWYFAYNGKKSGPLNQSHLILKISNLERLEEVLLWKKGENNWKPLFEFPKIVDILNEKLDEKKAA